MIIEGNQLLLFYLYQLKNRKESSNKNKNSDKFEKINIMNNKKKLELELTSGTGEDNDESSLEKIKEERINKQLENGELSNEIIEQIFSDF